MPKSLKKARNKSGNSGISIINSMKIRILGMMAALLTITTLCSFSLEDPFLALLKKLEEYTKRFPTEKAHLQLDKPYYAAGDNIWFKAYVADARNTNLTTQSNILYVELVDEVDSVCKQLRLPLENGISWGDFQLADTLAEGNYRIRAYTQLMRNAGSDFFFQKFLRIGSNWNNRVFARTSYAVVKQEGLDRLCSSIVFTDTTNTSLANRPVAYLIKFGSKSIRGRSRTNLSGQIDIILPSEARSGTIVASIDLGKGIKSVKTIPIKSVASVINVQFLPEAGKMIDGITSKIAVKAVDANGKGTDVEGTIIDDMNEVVSTFKTTYLGMGSFYLTPTTGRSYTAKVKRNDGSDFTVILPKAELSGHIITVNTSDTANVNIKVMLSLDLLNKGELKLIAHRDGLVFLATKISTATQVAKVTIPNNKFSSGIVQLTLLSPENLPVAERLVFVNNFLDKINLSLQKLKPVYNKKEKVDLELNTAVQGNFSVAVTNVDVLTPDEENESNIFTSMLLSSDLKGYIEKPNHYFMTNDASTRAHLDNLLLTQGWRKIDWKEIDASGIQAKGPSLKYPVEKSIKISGTITKNKVPLGNSKISLMSNSDGMFMIDTLSDKNGRFVFEGLEFPDSTRFIIQARSEMKKKTVDINLDIIDGQKVTPVNNLGDTELNVNESIKGYLKGSAAYFEDQSIRGLLSKSILLKEVRIEGKKINPARNSKNLNGPGNADQVFDGDDMINSVSLGSYLFSRMTGGSIFNGVAKVTRYGAPYPPFVVVVDGNIMENPFNLNNDIRTEDIESIEVLMSMGKTAIYGRSSGLGMLIITTRRGPPKWPVVKYAPGVITYLPKGYHNAREFYSPMYDMAPSDKPDLRTTVFWSPNLVTDESGKIKFDYFNTDQPGNYRVVIEGMDIKGNLARKVVTYQVK